MSKTAEERIAELENRLQQSQGENSKLQGYYNQAYKAVEESKQKEAYLRGQVESFANNRQEANPYSEPEAYESDSSSVDIEKALDRIIKEKLEPRMRMVEQYATDALQQTSGREVDRALKSFKEKNPESKKIMDFERLIMLDAADEVKRRQNLSQPVGDVKEIALEIAQNRVKKYNTLESKLAEENQKRRDAATKKAMVPDMFSAAGFDELPTAPSNAKEAGDLLEDLVRRQKAN
mgnify:FL=1